MNTQDERRNPVEELAEEFLLRYRRGERPTLTEYTDRYPDLADEIRDLFPALVMMEDAGHPGAAPHPATTVMPDGLPPRQLGEYRILRQVGRGGMGVVYEAEHATLGRHVALKVLPFESAANPTALERFRREARAAARLHHTNIVPVFDVGEHQGVPYYAMQFIAGQSLEEVLVELRRLRSQETPAEQPQGVGTAGVASGLLTGEFQPLEDEPAPPTSSSNPTSSLVQARSDATARSEYHYYRSVARLGQQAADALAHAHTHKLLHRDIKPSNLLLDPQGTLWVTDFGLAKEVGDQLTRTGDVVGTLRYMAPERFDGQTDPRSDLYSLGLTLYELLTLRPAFDEVERGQLIRRITQGTPKPPRQLDPHIPRDLETIVLKAAAREPGRRYLSAAEMSEDLGRFLADRPILARQTTLRERAWLWGKRNPAVALLTLTVFTVLLAGALSSTILWRKAVRHAQQEKQNYDEAEANFRETFQAVKESFTQISEDRLLQEPGMTELRKQLLESARPYFEKFVAKRRGDPAVRIELAHAIARLATIAEALDPPETALALWEQARRAFQEATDQPDLERDWQQARCGIQQGVLLTQLGRLREAETCLDEALRTLRRLSKEHPDNVNVVERLADARTQLARLVQHWGDPRRTLALLKEALDDCTRAAELRRHDVNSKLNLGAAIGSYGTALQASGQIDEGLTYLERALVLYREVLQSPSRLRLRAERDLAATLSLIGSTLPTATKLPPEQRQQEAERTLLAAQQHWEQLTNQFPTVAEYRRDRAANEHNLGVWYGRWNRLDDAVKWAQRGTTRREQLLREQPANAGFANDLALSYRSMANLANRRQAADSQQAEKWRLEVIEWNGKGVAMLRAFLDKHSAPPALRDRLAESAAGRAQKLHQAQRYDEALRDWDLAMEYANPEFRKQLVEYRDATVAARKAP